MSDTAWTIFTIVLAVLALVYFIAILLWIFWDDLVQPDTTEKPRHDIIEPEPVDPASRFRNLRKPVK